ncbi:unnamed protein product [Orchesella dallaii]|uniref:alkaline phosphatase n=1 Tax=Orchesella dallaii TaxID=48710 RepID=A0ABP1RL89_9HEXA
MLFFPTFPKPYISSGSCHLLVASICFYFVLINTHSCFGDLPLNSSEEIKAATPTTQQSQPTSATTEDSNYWFQNAEASLQQKILSQKTIKKKAKNVIFFIGHGMGVSTVTATRIFKGQQEGKSGEENILNLEHLPNVGLAKTFCQDTKVADSACSSTAFLCGTLANEGTIGLTSNVQFGDCRGQQNKSNHVSSVLAWAQARGMSTGIVTTTRVTHATPGATYVHSANSDWENDKQVKDSGENSELCDDIAEQLILGDVGSRINVILGGGRRELTPENELDVESNEPGLRTDGKNLIDSWLQTKNSNSAKYVWNKEQLLSVDKIRTDYLLGLFSYSDMDYVADADFNADPSLTEMTKVAIDVLSKNPNGYFLFIVAGRIDRAHHENKAQKAFLETIAMDDAILTAMTKTLEEETLLLVSSDYSNVMTISGYPSRGNPILGIAGLSDVDGLPYTTISYANGPGYKHPGANGDRYDLANDPLFDLEYTQMTGLPLIEETHGGEDVSIYSRGPWAHLLTGVNHHSFIPHLIAYAACLDIPGRNELKGAHCLSSSFNLSSTSTQ